MRRIVNKISMATIFVYLCLIFGLRNHGVLCVDKSSEDHSSNEVKDKDIKPELLNEHAYYLPKQTVFGSPGSSLAIDASKTSPPHIAITPTNTLVDYEQSTDAFEAESEINDDYIIPYSSYCVSETPSQAKEESELLLPSKDLLQNNVVLSGYIETPSKTSEDHQASKMSNIVSISSDVGQDSHIFTGNTSDI